MADWLMGNAPFNSGWFWITALSKDGNEYIPDSPQFYDGEKWIGIILSKSTVVAYSPIPKPAHTYKCLGYGYFLAIDYHPETDDEPTYYAKNYTTSSWSKSGYSTIEKAKVALRHRKKCDREDYPDNNWQYWIVRGEDRVCVYEERK